MRENFLILYAMEEITKKYIKNRFGSKLLELHMLTKFKGKQKKKTKPETSKANHNFKDFASLVYINCEEKH